MASVAVETSSGNVRLPTVSLAALGFEWNVFAAAFPEGTEWLATFAFGEAGQQLGRFTPDD